MAPYLAAMLGFATAAVLAMVNSWLTGRERVADEVRQQRIKTYPAVWSRTSVVSRWPRTDAEREHFLRLHEDLRRWYYAGGGLFLSTRARKRYEHLQLVLEAVLSQDDPNVARHYGSLMEAASYFRTGLTGDLETRVRRNPVVALMARRADGRERRKAEVRLKSIAAPADESTASETVGARPLHVLTSEDEQLVMDRWRVDEAD